MHFKQRCTSRVILFYSDLGGWEIDFNIPVVNMDVMKRETRSRCERGCIRNNEKNAINIFMLIKLIKTDYYTEMINIVHLSNYTPFYSSKYNFCHSRL